MIVFVSYARRDNQDSDLLRIRAQVSNLGLPYVDDLHDHSERPRSHTVVNALLAADTFVAVLSPNYLQTPWTRGEFAVAVQRKMQLLFLTPPGNLIDLAGGSLGGRAALTCHERMVRTADFCGPGTSAA
ncbi:toll/interleukin-1 receptor domain-containing protein [Nocardia xishanensis]|uniref:Toll/interleukin-1 receptor domain-containing protein n=1 Tax=Nocardia xishanensis TaxID=238964 RepID=A0ABW7WX73_9NOCA